MAKYKCEGCGYLYDPNKNNGVDFKNLPASWTCPCCGASKDQFL